MLDSKSKAEAIEAYLSVGFIYYFILARIDDLKEEGTPRYHRAAGPAIHYYRASSKSIEIAKDGRLQKVRFRVKDEVSE